MRAPVILFVLGSGLVATGMGWGAVLHVPEDYPSVLAGVDAAAAGDSVLVGPGTWNDHAVRTIVYLGTPFQLQVTMVLRPGVTVIGTSGAASTVLDGGAPAGHTISTIIHAQAGSSPARVVGFTITGGGQGVTTGGSNFLELVACRIVNNATQGVGIREGDVTMVDCLVADNEQQASQLQGGVLGIDVNVTCTGCTFQHNRGTGLRVFMAEGWSNGPAVTLHDCVFQDHTLRGAALGDVAYLDIRGCMFLRNSVSLQGGGGALSLVRCTGTLSFSTFAFDSAGSGGGATVAQSHVRVTDNTFYGCYAGTEAGALYLDSLVDVGVRENIFANSTGRRGAVAFEGATMSPDTGCNLFWNNAGGDYFGNWTPAPTDIHANPLFCDPVTLDFHLEAASPAAPAHSGGCGLIGAFDVNCGPVSVEPTSWGRLKGLFR